MKKDMVFLFIVLGGFFVSCTSWLDANSCHMGTSKVVANLLIVSKVGFFINPLRFCFLIPNKSEKAVLVNPFSFSNASKLSISLKFNVVKLRIVTVVMIYILLNSVKVSFKYYFLLVW